MKVVCLISGQGSHFIHLHKLSLTKKIPFEKWTLISSSKKSPALNYAEKNKILNFTFPFFSHLNFQDWDEQLCSLLKSQSPDLILLLGFLKKIGPYTLRHFPKNILNLHPSLLPKYGGTGFYGIHVHRAVLNNNEKQTGITLHLVNEKYDEGHIIAQEIIPIENIKDEFQLEALIKEKERDFLPKALLTFIEKNNF